MKSAYTAKHRRKFEVVAQSRLAEAAMMTLPPGGVSDEEVSNEHPKCEQWLFVIRGSGIARVVPKGGRKRSFSLKPGSLLVIEKGERHQIENNGTRSLATINFYVPPAYSGKGELRPAARK